MNKFMKDKRKIICLIIVLCVIFFSLLGILLVSRASGGDVACIYSNGELVRTIDLKAENEITFTVSSANGGYNVISVKNGSISVTDADCPDRICVHTGAVSDGVQPIVCMPNKLVIRIEARRTEYSHDS